MKFKKILISTVFTFILSLVLVSSTMSIVSAQNASSASQYAYIICGDSGNGIVHVVDTATNVVIDTINLGKWQGSVVISPAGEKVYVANVYNNDTGNNSAIYTIDTATNNISTAMSTGKGPSSIEQYIELISPKPAIADVNSSSNTSNNKSGSKNNKTDNSVIMINESGIPTVDYGYVNGIYVGKQMNPVTISNIALFYEWEYQKGNESCKQLFLNSSNYLVGSAVRHDNYTLWQYNFSWPVYNMPNPWVSGMAQGRGIHVLIRAYNMTGDTKYLEAAHLALNSFYKETKDGGVTYKDQNGWWYEEYVTGRDLEPRVLNGMVFALLGIYEYYKFTGDQDAKFLFDQGILSLKDNLYKFDSGNWSYYDVMGNRASTSYHKLHINQMLQLYEITKDPIFGEYHEKFQGYYEKCNEQQVNLKMCF